MVYAVFWEGKTTVHVKINRFEILISAYLKILYHLAQVYWGDGGGLIQKQHKISCTLKTLKLLTSRTHCN